MDAKTITAESLTGLVLTLSALHSVGLKLGHFGSTDFLTLAEEIVSAVLPVIAQASTPAQSEQKDSVTLVSRA